MYLGDLPKGIQRRNNFESTLIQCLNQRRFNVALTMHTECAFGIYCRLPLRLLFCYYLFCYFNLFVLIRIQGLFLSNVQSYTKEILFIYSLLDKPDYNTCASSEDTT